MCPPAPRPNAAKSCSRPGARLTPAAMAVAGSCGRHELRVYRRPQVAILSTGDELVDIAAEPAAEPDPQFQQLLAGRAGARRRRRAGRAAHRTRRNGAVAPPGAAGARLRPAAALRRRQHGQVRPGRAGFEHALGAEFFFTGAHIQPGRPIVFGRAPARPGALPTYFFGLPGNPVSTMVCFELFARTDGRSARRRQLHAG